MHHAHVVVGSLLAKDIFLLIPPVTLQKEVACHLPTPKKWEVGGRVGCRNGYQAARNPKYL